MVLEPGNVSVRHPGIVRPSHFRYVKTCPKIIYLAVKLYIRFPLSLPNVEDLLHEPGTEVGHKIVWYRWALLHKFREGFIS